MLHGDYPQTQGLESMQPDTAIAIFQPYRYFHSGLFPGCLHTKLLSVVLHAATFVDKEVEGAWLTKFNNWYNFSARPGCVKYILI